MANIGITGGPARAIKWGGITLSPVSDGTSKYQLSTMDYEVKIAGNQDVYTEGTGAVPYFEHDVVMSTAKYNEVVALKDGISRTGTVSLQDGRVLSLDCAIDGEFMPEGGVATLKLSGSVSLQ